MGCFLYQGGEQVPTSRKPLPKGLELSNGRIQLTFRAILPKGQFSFHSTVPWEAQWPQTLNEKENNHSSTRMDFWTSSDSP